MYYDADRRRRNRRLLTRLNFRRYYYYYLFACRCIFRWPNSFVIRRNKVVKIQNSHLWKLSSRIKSSKIWMASSEQGECKKRKFDVSISFFPSFVVKLAVSLTHYFDLFLLIDFFFCSLPSRCYSVVNWLFSSQDEHRTHLPTVDSHLRTFDLEKRWSHFV